MEYKKLILHRKNTIDNLYATALAHVLANCVRATKEGTQSNYIYF